MQYRSWKLEEYNFTYPKDLKNNLSEPKAFQDSEIASRETFEKNLKEVSSFHNRSYEPICIYTADLI